MIDFLIYLIAVVVGTGVLIVGIILLAYGIYGMTVPNFDKSIREITFFSGIACIFFFAIGYYYYNYSGSDKTDKYIGKYYDPNNKVKLKLKDNRTFIASEELFHSKTGTWKLNNFDEFNDIKIQSYNNSGYFRLKIKEDENLIQLIFKKDTSGLIKYYCLQKISN